MSRLYHNETGRVIPSLCEELTRYRRARAVLRLPATGSDATLFFLVRPHRVDDNPLNLSINGILQDAIHAGPDLLYRWYQRTVTAGDLLEGDNVVETWTDDRAMTGWSIALEAGSASTCCTLSDDGGKALAFGTNGISECGPG